jgi:hypothetical protein
MFVHPFGARKLITNSLSHLKVQKIDSKLGCKLKPMIINDIFRKTMILKNMIKE